MTEKLLLELIVLLLGCLLALIGFLFRSHHDLHRTLDTKLNDLQDQRQDCNSAFATKESVKRAHHRVDELETKHEDLSTRVTRLEACERGKP